MFRTRSLLVLLVAAVAVLLFSRLGATPVTDSAEDRCADVIEHMAESGDWLVPIRHGKPRLRKPPLYYWLGATSRAVVEDPLLGDRLPAALAALALLLVTIAWGRRAGGDSLGLGAGLALAFMLLFQKEGRRATAEMTLALFCNLALLAYFDVRAGRRRSLLPFGIASGLALLAKATPALLVVGAPVACDLACDRAARRRLLRPVVAWSALALLIGVSWYVVVAWRVPGALEEFRAYLLLPFGAKSAEGHGAVHHEPIWWYAKALLGAAFPAVLLLPLLWPRWRREGRTGASPALRFLALVFALGFVGFSLVPQKQKHYLLPLLPAFAVLLADSWIFALRERPHAARIATRVLGTAAVLAAGAGTFVLLLWADLFTGAGRLLTGASAAAALVWAGLAAAASLRGDGARAMRFLVPWLFLLFVLRLSTIEVWREEVKAAYDADRPLPDQERLFTLHRERPWTLHALGVAKKVRRTYRRHEGASPR